jgi:hypothetical protein
MPQTIQLKYLFGGRIDKLVDEHALERVNTEMNVEARNWENDLTTGFDQQ